jgi:hypothetical protein
LTALQAKIRDSVYYKTYRKKCDVTSLNLTEIQTNYTILTVVGYPVARISKMASVNTVFSPLYYRVISEPVENA